ncbi:MAG: flagellar biosynthetic protein FliO [Betaproteobacteria bacterium]
MSLMKEHSVRLCAGFSFCFFSFSCNAAGPAAQAPATAPSLISFGGMLQVLLGLGLVLAAVAGTAWLLRRFSPGQIGAGGAVKVIGGVAVGPKERLVLVEIGETWLVLGVAPGQVTALHNLPRPEGGSFLMEMETSVDQRFSSWLKQAMQGRKVG